jgi:hypothetical protein
METYIRNGALLSHIEYQADANSFDLNFPTFKEMVDSYNIPSTSSQPAGVEPSCNPTEDFLCGLEPSSTLPPSVGNAFSALINAETLGHR